MEDKLKIGVHHAPGVLVDVAVLVGNCLNAFPRGVIELAIQIVIYLLGAAIEDYRKWKWPVKLPQEAERKHSHTKTQTKKYDDALHIPKDSKKSK